MTPAMRERGTTLVETAVVMAVLLAIMFGIIDFGRALYTYSFVANAAREGARWAIVRGSSCTLLDHCPATTSDLQTYVRSLSEGATNPANIRATLQFPSAGGNAPGSIAEVTVIYPFTFMLPFMPSAGIRMTSTSEMIISN